MTTTLPPRAVRRCHHPVNLFHSTVYFSPEFGEELAGVGVTDPQAAYFAGRAAAMGAVGAGAVAGTFYNFNHALIARHLPAVWETASPADVLAARLRAADRTVRRLLGDAVDSAELAEAAGLALRATEACTRHARPLYAAHADLPVPDAPHLAYWHAATLLREHRGDAHLAALLGAGLDPLEAVVSHTATGTGLSPRWLLASRGWEQSDWDAAVERLRGRGLMDEGGALTEAGAALREEVEDHTDRMDTAPYAHLGAAGVERLTELAKGLLARAAAAGAFPRDLTGRG
ncbi:SCO6745 family protein [Streptomyces sp. enrichment culture]|uniref:SCO6745 family protein n=1 Tax=Streptomyces sp. enrichment culture TaxID=1795815 RepID=UPI003F57BB35